MCLHYSHSATLWYKLCNFVKRPLSKWVRIYKVVEKSYTYPQFTSIDKPRVCTPFRGMAIKQGGWFKSNRSSKKLSPYEKDSRVICEGIHVYLSKPSERCNLSHRSCIECRALKKDLVRVGIYLDSKEGVFTKIWIPQEELDRVLNTNEVI